MNVLSGYYFTDVEIEKQTNIILILSNWSTNQEYILI